MATVLTDILDTSNDYDYLIITDSSHNTALASLITAKEGRSLTVAIANVDAAGTGWADYYSPPLTSTQIRNFLRTVYTTWAAPPTYVVLVGTISAMPWYSSAPGDQIYSDPVGDMGAEYQLSRIPYDSNSLIEAYCDLAADHSTNRSGSWIDEILLLAHQQNAPGKYVACKNNIYADLVDNGYLVTKGYAEGSSSWPGASGQVLTKSEVKTQIENGKTIINYRGHGSNLAWAAAWRTAGSSTSDIDNTDVGAYSIGSARYPAVLCIACSNMALDSGSCFALAWLTKSPWVLGATVPSYTTENHVFDEALFDAITIQGLTRAGSIYQYAAVEVLRQGYTRNVRIYMSIGDPDAEIVGYGGQPQPPTPPEPPVPGDQGIIFGRAYYTSWMRQMWIHGQLRVQTAESAGLTLYDIPPGDVDWNHLKEAVNEHVFNLFIHNDHGSPTAMGGDYGRTVISTSIIDSMESMRGRGVYSFSCSTAKVLGPEMVKRGTRSYAGYTDPYSFCVHPVENGSLNDPLFTSTNAPGFQYMESLIAGQTFQTAFDDTLACFDTEIEYWATGAGSSSPYADDCISVLRWDRTLLAALGDLAFQPIGGTTPPPPPPAPTPVVPAVEAGFDLQAVRCFRHSTGGS